ncbi:MAG: C25 family cysteine peptidase, partial [Kiritimatiellia bacterium]
MNKCVWAGLVLGWSLAAGAAELSVEFAFSADDVELVPSGEYTVVGLADGARVVDEVGAPSIPAKFANILIPSGAQNVQISARGDETLLAEGITPYPAQPRSPKSQPRPAFVPANDRYASAAAWPAAVAAYQGDHDMQGYQFVSVRVNPLAYVGAEQKLYLRETVTVTVTYDAPVAVKSILPKQASLFGPLVDSLVVNPAAAAAFAPAVKTVAPKAALDYLIITSATLSNAFQQIADYRASAAGGGYTTRVLTTNDIGSAYSGADIQAKIRACISNSVATLGTTMVLLGGDDTVVLDRNCSVSAAGSSETEMPTDLYYSGLGGSWNSDGDAIYGETGDGVDLAWDVVVGRLPVRTAAQVTNYLGKVMTYESGSPVTNKIILGGPYAWDTYSGSGRPSDDVTIDGHAGFLSTSPAHTYVSDSEAWLRRLYRDGIRAYWPAQVSIICDTLTSWDGSTCGDYSQSSANTASKFNQNFTHLMFSGHGAPQEWGLESGSFDDADATSQTGLTAFVYTDACLTGHFDKNSNTIDGYGYTTEPCLAEAFLRNVRPLGGALAYMGCARYGWGEPDAAPASNTANGGPSTVYAYKFYKRMYETTNRTLGVAFAMHKADMASQSTTDDCERWIQFGVNLLGDPALKMPTGVVTPTAPSFGANPGPVSATTGVAKTFTVTANGNPTPVLALLSQTASSGYGFVPATGVLTYTPPTNDVGAQTFTFRATNTQGVATQIVSVTVSLAPPQAPASVWASATNTTSFT